MGEDKNMGGECPTCRAKGDPSILVLKLLNSIFGKDRVDQVTKEVYKAIDEKVGAWEALSMELGDEPDRIGYWISGDPERDILIPLLVGYIIKDRNTGRESAGIIDQLFSQWEKTDIKIEDKKKIIMDDFENLITGQRPENWPSLVKHKYAELSKKMAEGN